MTDVIIDYERIIAELKKFNDEMLYLGAPIIDNRLEDLEKQIGFTLPFDFKYIFKKHNGFSLDGTEVYGISDELRGSSLDKVYEFEHSPLIHNKMPDNFFPFSADGRGNHYCLVLAQTQTDISPVAFWQHDFDYDTLEEVEICNFSFIDWVNEMMISWKRED